MKPIKGHKLPTNGRCCGKKPIEYKRATPYLFCSRCCRDYDPWSLEQMPNWAWKKVKAGFKATYPDHDYAKLDPDKTYRQQKKQT